MTFHFCQNSFEFVFGPKKFTGVEFWFYNFTRTENFELTSRVSNWRLVFFSNTFDRFSALNLFPTFCESSVLKFFCFLKPSIVSKSGNSISNTFNGVSRKGAVSGGSSHLLWLKLPKQFEQGLDSTLPVLHRTAVSSLTKLLQPRLLYLSGVRSKFSIQNFSRLSVISLTAVSSPRLNSRLMFFMILDSLNWTLYTDWEESSQVYGRSTPVATLYLIWPIHESFDRKSIGIAGWLVFCTLINSLSGAQTKNLMTWNRSSKLEVRNSSEYFFSSKNHLSSKIFSFILSFFQAWLQKLV